MHQIGQEIQRDGVFRRERSDPLATQGGNMPLGAQNRGQIAGEGAHIDALAGADGQFDMVGVGRVADGGLMDHHPAARQCELGTLAGQVIGALAVDLDGAELRRDLIDLADKGRKRRANRLDIGPDVRAAGDLALAVEAVGRDPPVDGEAIDLLRLHHEGDGLGRLAEGDGQDAGGQRVEGAGVPRLLGVEQAADFRDRLGRTHAERLVETDPAVDDLALLAAAHQGDPNALAKTCSSATTNRSAPAVRSPWTNSAEP